MTTLEVLRSDTLSTPILFWNDTKRLDLLKVTRGMGMGWGGVAGGEKNPKKTPKNPKKTPKKTLETPI